MPRSMIVTRCRSLPNSAGVLLDYHADLVLELIVHRADNNEEDCEMLYAELELIETAIADLEAGANVLRPPSNWSAGSP
jgi:hypothetical protein